MQSLAAAVPEMLKAVAVTASAAANLWAVGKVIHVNVTNPANFIIRLTVFEGCTKLSGMLQKLPCSFLMEISGNAVSGMISL